LRVPAAARKGKRKPATYWLKPVTLKVLGRLAPKEGLIFKSAASPSSFYHRWKHLLEKAGLPTGRSEGPQKLRRSYATWIAAAGGDATAALGHSSSAITKRSYLDRSILEKPQNQFLVDIF
jgi:integrase